MSIAFEIPKILVSIILMVGIIVRTFCRVSAIATTLDLGVEGVLRVSGHRGFRVLGL